MGVTEIYRSFGKGAVAFCVFRARLRIERAMGALLWTPEAEVEALRAAGKRLGVDLFTADRSEMRKALAKASGGGIALPLTDSGFAYLREALSLTGANAIAAAAHYQAKEKAR